ncbi:hypothetical protein L6164_024039 [Bauhinia variegata]|uniref:Uncharacterized protein n=1 Tax=Bauhinia variegata TaxID=167791 RepID=A0ACB9LW18_BAUVA|nr:hypothetical protein L6164_024039 [Bauhinia variegata]
MGSTLYGQDGRIICTSLPKYGKGKKAGNEKGSSRPVLQHLPFSDRRHFLEPVPRTLYEELGKYGDMDNQTLCRKRVEELEPSIRYCLHKIGQSNLQASELLHIGDMAEARSQQAASMTEFHWHGHRFPISNAKTRVAILKAQELEKDLLGPMADSVPADKRLAIFDKTFSAYHEARGYIRADLAPRAWYLELMQFLLDSGFRKSAENASLFIYNNCGTLEYFLIYVDDIVLTGNNNCFLDDFVKHLAHRFSIKDLANLHHFLSVEVIPTTPSLFLSQHRHISDLLHKFHMAGAKEVTTPMAVNENLTLDDRSPSIDVAPYQSMVGSL